MSEDLRKPGTLGYAKCVYCGEQRKSVTFATETECDNCSKKASHKEDHKAIFYALGAMNA